MPFPFQPLLVAALSLATFSSFAQVSNDECSGAVALSIGAGAGCSASVSGTTNNATSSGTDFCYLPALKDVWYSFVAAENAHSVSLSNVDYTFGNADADFVVELFSGPCGNLNRLVCTYAVSSQWTFSFGDLTPGQTYFIRIANPYDQPIDFDICMATPPTPPANDGCAGAVALNVDPDADCDAPTGGTTLHATTSPVQGCSTCYWVDDDVWYSFTATQANHFVQLSNVAFADNPGAPEYAEFQVFSGTCGNLTYVQGLGVYSSGNLMLTNLAPGQNYYIRLYTNNFQSRISFDICVTSPPPPANDECSAASPITLNAGIECIDGFSGSTYLATSSASSCDGAVVNDVWLKFVATSSQHRIQLNPAYGLNTFGYEVYSGGCGNLASVACGSNYDFNIFLSGLTPGDTYYIRVFSGPNSYFDFYGCVLTLPPPPANDECSGAEPLAVNGDASCAAQSAGSTLGATSSAVNCTGQANTHDVWYSFVATAANHRIEINLSNTVFGNYNEFGFEVYEGDCDNLVSKGCRPYSFTPYNALIMNGLTPGETYFVRVYSNYGSGHQFSVCVQTVPPAPANVHCADATTIIPSPTASCSVATSGSTAGILSDTASICYYYGSGMSLWYSFTATSGSHIVRITDIQHLYGSNEFWLEIYQGDGCGNLFFRNCYPFPGTFYLDDLSAGTTYYLRWSSAPFSAHAFNICIGTYPPPANDACADAIPLTVDADLDCNTPTPGTTAGSTFVPSNSCFGASDVWYSFTATQGVHHIALSDVIDPEFGGGQYVRAELFSGNCGNLNSLKCWDSFYYGSGTLVAGDLTAGETYYLRIGNPNSTPVNFNICVLTPPPPPANDACANAVLLTPEVGVTCGTQTAGTTLNATSSYGVPVLCCGAGDVWYTFVATQATHLINVSNVLDAQYGYPGYGQIEVYSSACGTFLSEGQPIGYDSDSWLFTNLMPGSTYHIRVFSANSYYSPAIIFDICVNAPAPPANDDCANAMPLPVNTDLACTNSLTVSTFGATQSKPSCFDEPVSDVWCQFTAASPSYRIDLNLINGYYSQWGFEVLTGDCNDLFTMRCENTQYYNSSFTLSGLNVGDTYYLRFFSSRNMTHEINVCVRELPFPPPNDECVNAVPLQISPDLASCTTQVTGTTLGATQSMTSCYGGTSQDVWYSFVANGPAQLLDFSVTNTYFDGYPGMDIQLFSGSCNNLNNILCTSIYYQNSLLLQNLSPGETYYLRISSPGSGANDFLLCLKTMPPPPANDDCAQAAEIAPNSGLNCDLVYPGVTTSASSTPLYYGADVWFHFTASSNNHIVQLLNNAVVYGYAGQLNFDIFQGADCNGLLFMGSYNAVNPAQLVNFQPGQSYYIRVYSTSPDAAYSFDLCIKTLPPSPPNEICTGAYVLTPNAGLNCDMITSGTTAGAIESTYTYCGGYGNDIWYQFTATSNTHLIQASNITPVLNNGGFWVEVLQSTDCATFTYVSCAYYDQSVFLSPLIPGATYYVKVTSEYGSAHNFDLCIKTIPPPPNDLCADAIALEVDADQYCDNAVSGTSSGAGPSGLPSCSFDGNDVWYSFTATQAAHTILLNNVFDALGGYGVGFAVEIYTGSCDNLQILACRTNLYYVDQFTVGELTAGEVYYIRVITSGYGSNFDICVGTPPPPPVNDACSAATNLPVSPGDICTTAVSGTLENATPSPGPYYGSGLLVNDVWYSFTATQPNHVITVNDVNYPSFITIEVQSGACGTSVPIALQLMYFDNHLLLTNLVPGETYFIRVYNAGNLPTNFDICVTSIPVPPNDECAGAIPVDLSPGLSCLYQTNGSSYGATQSSPGCAGYAANDVWFKFTATSPSHYLKVNSFGGPFAYYYFGLEVYKGSCGVLETILPCSENYYESGYTLQNLVPGETYYIRLYSAAFTYQSFSLCILTLPEPPANDECAQATAIQANSGLECDLQYNGSTLGATQSALSCYGYATHDVWYSFTALGTSQIVKAEITGYPLGSGTLGMEVYNGSNCSGFSGSECYDFISGTPIFLNGLSPGATYYLRMFSFYNSAVEFNLCIQTLPPPPANDNCSEAEVILPNDDIVCYETASGTTAGITDIQYLGCNYGPSAWYQFTATSSTHLVRLSDIVGRYGYPSLGLELYQGTCDGLQLLTCSYGSPEMYLTSLTAGAAYFIRVVGVQNAGADFNLCILTPPAPYNDDCATAYTLSTSATPVCETGVAGTTLAATQSPESGICTYGADIWYSFVASSTMHTVQITNTGSSSGFYELVYEVFSGQCRSFTSLGCYNAYSSPVYSDLTPGDTYYIRVGTYNPSIYTNFVICVTTPLPDLSVYYIYPYSDGCNAGTNETVQAAFFNAGSAPIPPGEAGFTLTVSGSNNGTYGPVTNPFTIYPYNVEYVTFTGVDLSTPGLSQITATASVSNDANPSDNSNNINFNTLPLVTYYFDADGDGYGDAANYLVSCYQYEGYVTSNADCDDANANIHPEAAEFCNGADDDCDGLTDADDPGLIDTIPPVITCPANMVVNNASGDCSAIVNYTVTATDDCAYSLSQTAGIASGQEFPVGTTSNTFAVSDAGGHEATCSFTVEVKKTGDPNLLYAYTVIGFKEVSMKQNTVQSGGIGVVNAGKKAILQQATIVTAPNTFVKAPVLQLQGGSEVTTYYSGQVASNLLPAFQPNNNVGNNNVTIPNNSAPLTLNLNKYGKITVGNNVTVTFSGHATVRIKELEIKENATVLFAQGTVLLVDKKIAVGNNSDINPGGSQSVQIFAEDKITIGKGVGVTANMYTQKELTLEKATAGAPTYMTGQFIADKVDAQDYAYWNWNAGYCPFSPITSPPAAGNGELPDRNDVKSKSSGLVRLFPNPATETVQVAWEMGADGEAVVQVLDAAGRLVRQERFTAASGRTQYRLDLTGLAEGMYHVRVTAGELRAVEKLVIIKP